MKRQRRSAAELLESIADGAQWAMREDGGRLSLAYLAGYIGAMSRDECGGMVFLPLTKRERAALARIAQAFEGGGK